MIVVNLFAGPGAGKSSLAAMIFAELKQKGVTAELVTEFAKDCVWEGRNGPLKCQPYVFGEQLWRMERLRGRGVEVLVTDSPLLLSTIYARETPGADAFAEVVRAWHDTFTNFNVRVIRSASYDTRGRLETAEEAAALDSPIWALTGGHASILRESLAGFDEVISRLIFRVNARQLTESIKAGARAMFNDASLASITDGE